VFGRLLLGLVRGSRGRLLVALVALTSAGAVLSVLANIDLDVEKKLTQQFRTLGANLVIAPARASQSGPLGGVLDAGGTSAAEEASGAASPELMSESIANELERNRAPEIAALSPYLYVVARAHRDRPVVVVGAWLDQMPRLNPSWKVEGNWVERRDDVARCLIGRDVARNFQLPAGGEVTLSWQGRSANLTVAGIVEAGGAEDSQIFVNLPVAQTLIAQPGEIELVQLSVTGTEKQMAAITAGLAATHGNLEVRPIRQIAQAEGQLLGRIRLLILLMVLLILVLTLLCLLATMAALAIERRADVGLMKALGGSISRIVAIFLAEAGLLGAAGGVAGYVLGFGLTYWMGRQVFHASVSPRWEVFPFTVAVMIAAALAGAYPLRWLGKVKPAEILRGE
jgi:putative ABC transport system permease protein